LVKIARVVPETHRQTQRQTDTQTDRQTDTQTDVLITILCLGRSNDTHDLCDQY